MLEANARSHWRFAQPRTIGLLASFCSRHAWLALPLLALPAVLPYWLTGFPETADGHLHLLRLALLDRYVEQGWLYPRWIPDLMLGRGYPLLNFYAPASYYLAEGLHLLGLGYQHALAGAFILEVLAAGVGMYLLAGEILGRSQCAARLIAATAYMYAPYLLANTFVRGAVAEVGAQALLPWVFWTTHRLLTRGAPKRDIVPAALAIAGLAITHNITLLFLPLVWVAYVLVLWSQGSRRDSLLWAGGAAFLAMLLSAFFWLPMAVERAYLSNAAYEISARSLHENVWSWRNFLDPNFFYQYGYDLPNRVGLVQLVLALAGFLLARRKDAIWLFFAGLALVVGFAIGEWSLPIWLNSRLLLTVQFPWRLLSILSVPLALFTGALVLPIRQRAARFAVTLALLALIIVAQRPTPAWSTSMALDSASIRPASAAHFESDSGAMGTSNASEFLPRWVARTHLSAAEQPGSIANQVRLQAASAFDLLLQVSGDGGPLRVNTFYYPGWRAVLGGGQVLQPYPSTDLGLLTVDVPPGTHALTLRWDNTPLARVASYISLIALIATALWCLWLRPKHPLAAPLIVLIALACLATFYRPSPGAVTQPAAEMRTDSLALVGYQLEHDDGQHVLIRPFWYTSSTPPPDLSVRWQLLDRDGQVVSQVEGRPYYGAGLASDWPPGTIVSDVYRLPLPPETITGNYQLAAQFVLPDVGSADALVVGAIDLPAAQGLEGDEPASVDVRFGDAIVLRGYGLLMNGRPVSLVQGQPPLARPGDRLEYLLYWQGNGPITKNYHGFVHLLDQAGEALAMRDQSAGTIYGTSMLWDTTKQPPDRYRIVVPPDSPSGLYTAAVGLYDFKTHERLPVETDASTSDATYYPLPPVKVLGRSSEGPEHELSALFGDFGRLTGYTLRTPPQLHPGDQIHLTLYYQADMKTAQNLTRFVQLHSPDLGMAAQKDSIPQDGQNPTWSWAPGEQIREDIVLSIASDAAPGRYTLGVGLYDPQNGGIRIPVTDEAGRPVPDARIILTELEVVPRG